MPVPGCAKLILPILPFYRTAVFEAVPMNALPLRRSAVFLHQRSWTSLTVRSRVHSCRPQQCTFLPVPQPGTYAADAFFGLVGCSDSSLWGPFLF